MSPLLYHWATLPQSGSYWVDADR